MAQYSKGQAGGSTQPAPYSDADIKQIIQGDDLSAAQKLVETAEKLGRELAKNKLKSAQIRGIFGTVRLIETKWSADKDAAAARSLLLLKPKLAYQVSRKKEIEQLADALSKAIDLVGSDRARFQRFVEFFEAVLAYHKAAGGE